MVAYLRDFRLFFQLLYANCQQCRSRNAGTGVHYGGTAPSCSLKGGSQVPLNTSIISNFIIYQDQFVTNLLQLFAQT